MTWAPSLSRASQRWDPRKPAPPATKTSLLFPFFMRSVPFVDAPASPSYKPLWLNVAARHWFNVDPQNPSEGLKAELQGFLVTTKSLPLKSFEELVLQRCGAVRGGMLGKNAPPRRVGYLGPPCVARGHQRLENVVRVAREHDLAIGEEQRFKTVPHIRNDRRAAGRSLEETHARGVAGTNHVGSRHVERESARGVERRVLVRGHMVDAVHIRRPGDRVGILWARDHEAPMRRAARWFDEQAVERRLPVGAVGAEIGQVPALGPV